MNDEWILSVADLIEALGCTRDDIVQFLGRGELLAARTEPIGIAHSELCRFVDAHRRDALQLGTAPRIDPAVSVLHLAPFDDESNRPKGNHDATGIDEEP